jgi:metallo-beta-lactamase family protein
VQILGANVEIKAQARSLTGFSAHADQPRLLKWLKPLRLTLKRVYVVQGEPEASLALADKIRDELVVDAEVPKPGMRVVL